MITVHKKINSKDCRNYIRLTVESQFNQTLSKPESDLGSPETENLEIETESNVDAKKKI